jgi:UDP-MurNAc hydroxylase
LRKLFDRNVHILVPKVPTRRMVRDLSDLGFDNVTEVSHNGEFRLGDDFVLRSYQFGPAVDSAIVLTGGGTTLFNCNDCKYFGIPLKQITRRFPKIDFVLRSHSSATPIPYCIEGYEKTFPQLRSQQDYIEEFSRFALFVGAKYAIPFASNHCFLHKDTIHYNDTTVSPEDVRAYYEQLAAELHRDSECVVMAPGSSWSQEDGFQIVPFSYADRKEYLQTLLARHAPKLNKQYELERDTKADFKTFQLYFERFLASLPWTVRKWLRLRIVFRTRDRDGEHNWLVDFGARKVEIVAEPPADCVIIETPALVLNDCTSTWMFSVWSASKRLKITLPTPDHLSTVTNLLTLLDLYELETLPLRRNLSRRSLGIRLRRWREALEAGRLFVKHKLFRRPFSLAGLYHLPRGPASSPKRIHPMKSPGRNAALNP